MYFVSFFTSQKGGWRMEKVKVIIYGVGAMGSGAVRLLAGKEWVQIVGAIGHKRNIGKDIGEVAGIGRKLGVIISDNPGQVFGSTKADICLHATGFTTEEDVFGQILMALDAGCNVISMVDTRLFYPWEHWPEQGRRIDEAARKNGVTFLETGVNPGFTMDQMPLLYTGICGAIEKITVKEAADMDPFGTDVLQYLHIGLPLDVFNEKLADSSEYYAAAKPFDARVDMIADALGWKLDEVKVTVEPIVSEKRKVTRFNFVIEPGIVCGIRQMYRGKMNGRVAVETDWILTVFPEEDGIQTGNFITIDGDPSMKITISGLTEKGDVVTYARFVNCIPQVLQAKPGLATVMDLPVSTLLKP